MITEDQIKRIQSLIGLYLARYAGSADESVHNNGTVVIEFICYITGHDCDSASNIKGILEDMEKELVRDGVDIEDAIKFVDAQMKLQSLRNNAKFN